MLSFVAIGLDHTTAGIALRERVAFSDAEIPAALRRLTDPTDRLLDQAAILSTCNRVERIAAWSSNRSVGSVSRRSDAGISASENATRSRNAIPAVV